MNTPQPTNPVIDVILQELETMGKHLLEGANPPETPPRFRDMTPTVGAAFIHAAKRIREIVATMAHPGFAEWHRNVSRNGWVPVDAAFRIFRDLHELGHFSDERSPAAQP